MGSSAQEQKLYFCNGINTPTMEDAKTCAQTVSNAFGGRRVVVFHNTTSLGNIFDSSESYSPVVNAMVESIWLKLLIG